MPETEKPDRMERLGQWLRTPARPKREPSERMKKIGRGLDKLMYATALFPLGAALWQYLKPSALIEVKGGVSGKGIPSGVTVERIYVLLDQPSTGQRLLMASPWIVLTVTAFALTWLMRFIQKRAHNTEGDPYPPSSSVALVGAQFIALAGLWMTFFLNAVAREDVGVASYTDAEVLFAGVLALVICNMCIVIATLQSRGSRDHKELEEIV